MTSELKKVIDNATQEAMAKPKRKKGVFTKPPTKEYRRKMKEKRIKDELTVNYVMLGLSLGMLVYFVVQLIRSW